MPVMMVDSQAVIGFARNNGGTGRMKHLDIREKWVQLLRLRNRFTLEHVPGTKNKADFFTKIQPGPLMTESMNDMMGRITDPEVGSDKD